MEQYWMPKKLDFQNLRLCLDSYAADYLYIRLVGSRGGAVKVSEDLTGKTLDFRKDKAGLRMLIDSKEAFRFPLRDYQKGFSLAYARVEATGGGIGRRVILSHGTDPYDPKLPEPELSFLRIVLDNHLMEIFFKGRVNLKFHSWWSEPHWKYWTIDKPGKIPEGKPR